MSPARTPAPGTRRTTNARRARAAPDPAATPRPASPSARQGIQSVETGVGLLRALAAANEPVSLKALSAAAGMAPAKAHRYLVSFIRTGLVEQEPASSRYDLGAIALQIGLAALARLDPMRIALPALARLREEIGQTVALAVWGTHGPTVVRWLESTHPVTAGLRTGAVLPLTRSATGLVFAAFLPDIVTHPLLEAEFAHLGTRQAAARRKALAATLAGVRTRRMAVVNGELVAGVDALAAPVFDAGGRPVLAIAALGHASTFDARPAGKVARALRAATLALSQQLGHGHFGPDEKLEGVAGAAGTD